MLMIVTSYHHLPPCPTLSSPIYDVEEITQLGYRREQGVWGTTQCIHPTSLAEQLGCSVNLVLELSLLLLGISKHSTTLGSHHYSETGSVWRGRENGDRDKDRDRHRDRGEGDRDRENKVRADTLQLSIWVKVSSR